MAPPRSLSPTRTHSRVRITYVTKQAATTVTSDKGAACNASTGVAFTDQTGLASGSRRRCDSHLHAGRSGFDDERIRQLLPGRSLHNPRESHGGKQHLAWSTHVPRGWRRAVATASASPSRRCSRLFWDSPRPPRRPGPRTRPGRQLSRSCPLHERSADRHLRAPQGHRELVGEQLRRRRRCARVRRTSLQRGHGCRPSGHQQLFRSRHGSDLHREHSCRNLPLYGHLRRWNMEGSREPREHPRGRHLTRHVVADRCGGSLS